MSLLGLVLVLRMCCGFYLHKIYIPEKLYALAVCVLPNTIVCDCILSGVRLPFFWIILEILAASDGSLFVSEAVVFLVSMHLRWTELVWGRCRAESRRCLVSAMPRSRGLRR